MLQNWHNRIEKTTFFCRQQDTSHTYRRYTPVGGNSPPLPFLTTVAKLLGPGGTRAVVADSVRRVLAKHCRPPPHDGGPSWPTFIGHLKDSLWSVDLFRCDSILLETHWVLVVMDQFTRRIIGTLPDEPPEDTCGLPMEMVFCLPRVPFNGKWNLLSKSQ